MSITTIFYTAVAGGSPPLTHPQRRRIHWRRGYFGTCVASWPNLRRCEIPQSRNESRIVRIELTKSLDEEVPKIERKNCMLFARCGLATSPLTGDCRRYDDRSSSYFSKIVSRVRSRRPEAVYLRCRMPSLTTIRRRWWILWRETVDKIVAPLDSS